MKVLFAAVAVAALAVSGAAHADEIADRKAAMKKNGQAMGVLVKTVKGEMAFDQAAVMEAFKTQREATEGFAELFPEGTETGGETTASPKIWEDMDGFKAQLADFHEDLDAAIAAEPASLEEFQVVFGPVGENCQACHQDYRIKKE